MFLWPVIYGITGLITSIISMVLFFVDYKYVLINKKNKRYLLLNILAIVLSTVLLIFSIIYVFVIQKQI
jgi:hypothetical protein